MLTQIKLKNFKIFKEETAFPLAKINLLTGINGRGKSSLLQALLLMKQSVDEDVKTSDIYLNGSCIDLGNTDDINNKDSLKGELTKISLDFVAKRFNGNFTYILEPVISKGNNLLKIKEIKIENDGYVPDIETEIHTRLHLENRKVKNEYDDMFQEINPDKPSNPLYLLQNLIPSEMQVQTPESIDSLFLRNTIDLSNIHYISASRVGPQNYYEKYSKNKRNEDIVNILSQAQNNLVHDTLYLGEDTKDLLQQSGEWLSVILDTPNVSILLDDDSNDFIITLRFKIGTKEYKPSNVGFGFSYVLPIIVSGLIAKEGEILIVENPEAHLHPRAQSKLTEFLSKVASTGVQVFIESHSEHILNGLRIVAINQDINIDNEDISVLYFHEKEEGYFTQIPIKPNGKIEKWEEGFFDQAEHDLDILLGI